MSVRDVMVQLGGVATRADLVSRTSRSEVDRALLTGEVVSTRRGRYSLPDADAAVAAAHRLSGHLGLTSAALHHGWEVKTLPEVPHVVVPRSRRAAAGVHLHRRDLHPDEVDGIATDPGTTLEMCLRLLPFDEGLTVADSFLRHGGSRALLRGIARSARGHGAAKMRRVAAAASEDAANPFESVLRALALDVPGLHVEPQRVVRSPIVWARPDLVDEDLRLVLEADSFAWHGQRSALDRDANRYNRLVASGWTVLRFTWEAVMLRPEEVQLLLGLTVAGLARPGLAA